MSLITCCPACQTMFKVAGEDLRVSDGWVRCGKCDGVFDASAHLQVMAPPPGGQDGQSGQSGSDGQVARAEQVEQAAQAAPEMQAKQVAQAPTWEGERSFPPSEPALPFPLAERPSLFRAATSGGGLAVEPDVSHAESGDVQVPRVVNRAEFSPGALRREDRSARPAFTQEPVNFSASSTPTRSAWRIVFWLLALAVVWAALVGWARHEREALVQRMPAMLPALDWVCKVSACEVQAPRLLDAIAIEGASMQEVAPSEYKVQLLLKNSGNGAVAMPGLNVTLTGLQGEVLARHMALASEFTPGVTRLAPNLPLSVTLSFKVPAATAAATPASDAPQAESVPAPAALPVSGYRVIAFYP